MQGLVKVQESPSGTLQAGAGVAPKFGSLRRKLLTFFPFQVVLVFVLLVLLLLLAGRGMADPDIWWHLRNAGYLLKNHELPRYDTYSFTVAGQPWINHEWLSEIPYYLAWQAFGLAGVKSLSLVLIFSVFVSLLYLCYKSSGNFKAAFTACAFTSFLATVSFGPRTILFGYLYLVVMLIVLERFRREGNAPLWILPPLFCLWVNSHGSWLLGLVIFSITVAAGLVSGRWGRIEAIPWTRSQWRRLLIVWTASVAAIFVNPFGYRLVLYPFDLAFRQKLNISHIAEWVSVDFHILRGKLTLVLLIALLLSALARRRRWSLTELVILLFALYSGLTYTRFLFLLAIVVSPLLAKILDFFPPYRPELETPLVNTAAVCLMLAFMVWYWPQSKQLQSSVDEQYPREALTFLKAHPPAGPMLNFYLWGGYLGWNDSNLKVFVDSRVDIFEYAGVFQDYLDLLGLKDSQKVLDKYKIRYVLFPGNEPLVYLLQANAEWQTVYRDNLCILLERKPAQGGLALSAGSH